MVVLRSGRNLETGSSSYSSSIRSSSDVSDLVSKLTSQPTRCRPPLYCHNGHLESGRWRILKNTYKHPAEQYVTQALDSYNQNSLQNYKLVEAGGMIPVFTPSCTILHVNFTAKNANVAGAPEEIFFTELIYFPDKVLSVSLCKCMGPINSISGVDKLNGCRFCTRYNNVQHPEGGGFIRGDDIFYKTVQDICDIDMNNTILDEDKHLPMEGEYPSEQVDDARLYATEAVTFYNQIRHTNYELVEPGFITGVILPTCSLFHINFTAKKSDVAPEEMFFAELTSANGVHSFSLCVCMGKKGSISGDKLRGCYYCRKYNNVQHPRAGRFVRGGDSLYKKIPGEEITRDPALLKYLSGHGAYDQTQC